MTRVRFLQPFVYAGATMTDSYSFNANTNVEGYLDDEVAADLINEGLAEAIV